MQRCCWLKQQQCIDDSLSADDVTGRVVLVESRSAPLISTNNQLNPSVTAILEQCMSLSTGTSVSQFVSHPSQHIDMPCMALGESLTAISLLYAPQIQSEVLQGL